MTIVPNSLHEPTVKTDTKFVDFCRDVQKSQVDVEMFSENRAKLPHITLTTCQQSARADRGATLIAIEKSEIHKRGKP